MNTINVERMGCPTVTIVGKGISEEKRYNGGFTACIPCIRCGKCIRGNR
jgi:hypothetical protein